MCSEDIALNGYSDFEIKTRDEVRRLINLGGKESCDKARALGKRFVYHKRRRAMRAALLRTVRNWVSVANGSNTKEMG